MSEFKKCPTCESFGWFGSKAFPDHRCAPAWEARELRYDDEIGEPMTVYAGDAEGAATAAAAKAWKRLRVVAGFEPVLLKVYIGRPGEKQVALYTVDVEMVPEFIVRGDRRETVDLDKLLAPADGSDQEQDQYYAA